MDHIEVSGKTREEAIMKASVKLETPSDELDIEVVSEGSKGFLGFGSKPYVIRARKKMEAVSEVVEETEEIEKIIRIMEPAATEEIEIIDEGQPEQLEETQPREDRPKDGEKEREPDRQAPAKSKAREHRPKREGRPIEVLTDEAQIEEVKRRAEEFLASVFEAMHIDVHMESVYNMTDGSLTIDFSGENMGILIGKRGQTLDSLQYLTGLVLNKGKNVYVKVKLDTEDYRARRKETLENLARGIAFKVKKSKRQVVLEPMNPYERRIIHSTLQGNRNVETFSEGEEPFRHVVVKPKNR